MRRITAREWAHHLFTLMEHATQEEINTRVQEFVVLVRLRHATKLLPRIMTAFAAQVDAAHGVVQLKTVGAHALSKEVEAALKETYGHATVIDHTIDPHVIGGLKLQVGDVIIDGTVKTALQKFYEN